MSIERLIQLQVRQNELQEATLLEMRGIYEVLRSMQKVDDDDKWLDNADLMQLLHVDRTTIWRWRACNEIPYKKAGRKWVYRERDVLQLKEKLDRERR